MDILNWYCKIHRLPRPVWEYDKTTKVWKVTVSSNEHFSDNLRKIVEIIMKSLECHNL